jgi:hypothetical protein
MDFEAAKEMIRTHLGLILTIAVPVAAVAYQTCRSSYRSNDIGEPEEPEEVVVTKPRGSSFYKSEKILETHKDPENLSHKPYPTWLPFGFEQPLVIAMVGLPARGKSYIVNMIIRYLKWIGIEARVFNVGSYRRKMGLQSADSKFFDGNNEEGKRMREELAMAVQDSMYEWLHSGKEFKRRVAIFDATNTTIKRRLLLSQHAKEKGVELLFVESICNDQEVLRQNYNLKLQNDDYKGMDPEKARQDFMDRVRAYEKVYEVRRLRRVTMFRCLIGLVSGLAQTIEDDEDDNQISYIKLVNVGQKVITRNCHGYLPSQVAFYLQNVHIQPRKIYLSVNAEAVNVSDLVGGESCACWAVLREYVLASVFGRHRPLYMPLFFAH